MHIALTTVVEGKPTATTAYSIDELLTFVNLLLHSLDKIQMSIGADETPADRSQHRQVAKLLAARTRNNRPSLR